ncbi:clarin-3 [Daktulosphaira vitifoliae]|uniref:clarin-3 n=1 Tax=Daktulosphaira vitifoliae TaxID=58002 RepID=UPI0021AA2C05|nr:clarin-3 [Daktulosphaira vitifoliae]
MSLNKRRLIFCTFIYSCAAIGLLGAALGTKRWVVASARRTSNTTESVGQVNLGLFYGDKYLNIGYGLRTYSVDVIEMMKNDPEIMIYSLWVLTVIFIMAGLTMTIAAAVFAVINSAITPISALAGVPGLYFWNISAILFELFAAGLWVTQFYQRLQFNVMSKDDRRNKWTSEGNASLGYSFWFIILASILHMINVFTVFWATCSRTKKSPSPIIEEKTNGAIMLY